MNMDFNDYAREMPSSVKSAPGRSLVALQLWRRMIGMLKISSHAVCGFWKT
jgi:hypothetical protein